MSRAERINTPISTKELERRWAAVRSAMADRKVDVLLMQANNDFMGGYVKYFTDLPAVNGYPVTVVFPRDDRMTVVSNGGFDFVQELPPEGDEVRRGVARVLGTPSFVTAHYTSTYDAVLAERALERYAGATVGLLGTAAMSFALVDHLKRRFTNARFEDASDLVDQIKAIKSEEEIALIRGTAAMQDGAMEAVLAGIKPGMRDLEVAAIAEHYGRRFGSEQGLFLCASGPVGTVPVVAPRHQQNRVIQAGDQFSLLIESNAAGGYYTEIGRTCVLGKASQEMKDEFEFLLKVRQFTIDLFKPGASCKAIWEAYNGFMASNRRIEERRLNCHSQGYDIVERPLIRSDETMSLQKNMVIAFHPTYFNRRTFNWICDDFLIGDTCERLHKFPVKLFELG